MTETPTTKFQLKVIEGGKPAPQPNDPVVKLRFNAPPPEAPKPLTAAEIADLKVLNEIEDGE